MPDPYRRAELRQLRASLDTRWPLLDCDQEAYWVRRWRSGISPYERVRVHAIRLQLDAIIGLALRCGLRRSELWSLEEMWLHPENTSVIVWYPPGPWEGPYREVPYVDSARAPVRRWLDFRAQIQTEHERPWLNPWSARTLDRPMSTDTLNRLLPTYIGPGWSFRRLRDTCAVAWLRSGLPIEDVRQLLGLESIEAVLLYARLIGGDMERRMVKAEERFDRLVTAGVP